MTLRLLLSLVFLISSAALFSQPLTQTVRGTVVDDVSRSYLPGATVVMAGTNPLAGSVTDTDGNFRIEHVPLGTYRIVITFVGYKESVLSNIIVNSGKETILNVSLVEDITQMKEVVILSNPEKNKPLNETAAVSARTFSVEETRKYAAAVNDPARMVVSYAGVVQTDDGNNSISIRGNAPFGLQWRMEGIEIPNPNHFANVGASGGGISILSAQLLSNSDFMTGAFPAEYGNALSGVFDLRLRRGNNEQHENTFQAGLLGIDFATEGPFSNDHKSSYLVNYRYSTLSLLNQLGVPIGFGVTDFQDLSYNITLPSKKAGTFSLFGFSGLSSQRYDAKKDSTKWEDDYERYDSRYHSNTGAAGVKHMITFGNNVYVQSDFLLSVVDHGYAQQRLNGEYIPQPDFEESYSEKRFTANSVVNYKLSSRSFIRSGISISKIYYTYYEYGPDKSTGDFVTYLDSKGNANIIQGFTQWNYRPGEKITINTGLHYVRFLLNNTESAEPRASITWQPDDIQSFSLGYGLHGQILPIGVYFAQSAGSTALPNENLDFMKAHHLVVSYDRSLNKYMRVKVESYYQHLYHIPVGTDLNDPLSLINVETGYETDALVNQGLGRNYGVEFTLEQFLHRNTYYLFSTSLYDSKYRALDGMWRNTRYNGNYAFSFTGGKDFTFQKNGKEKAVGVNLRTLYLGGFRTTPIDVQQSIDNGETAYITSQSFSAQLPAYFRSDLRISYKVNRRKTTSTLALDIQNATNHQNLFGEYFDPFTGKVKTIYQTPLIPIISYKIEF